MAYSSFYNPTSYADLFYNSPYGYVPRQPSPPPSSAYYPRDTYNRYSQDLAREQAARAVLQKAAQQERARRALAARAQEQRRQHAIEQARREREARIKAHQQHRRYRPQSQYGFPFFDDGLEDEGESEEASPDSSIHEPRRQSIGNASSLPQPAFESQKRTSTSTMSSNADPACDVTRLEEAANTIQRAFRKRASIKHISAIRSRFSTLNNSFTFPTHLTFESSSFVEDLRRGRLAYNKENAPIHAFIDECERMLQELDAIESRGDADVREMRRNVVKTIEARLKEIEEDVKKAWDEQQAVPTSDVQPHAETVEQSVSESHSAPVVKEAPSPMEVTNEPLEDASSSILPAPTTPGIQDQDDEAKMEIETALPVPTPPPSSETPVQTPADETSGETEMRTPNAETDEDLQDVDADEGKEVEDALVVDEPVLVADSVPLTEVKDEEEEKKVEGENEFEAEEKDFVML